MNRTRIAVGGVLLLLAGTVSAQPPSAELRSRLAKYEQQVATGRTDDAELASLASAVLAETAIKAAAPAPIIAACTSRFVPADVPCADLLWTIAKDQSASLRDRTAAAAGLVTRKEPKAASLLLRLVNGAGTEQLAGIAPSLVVLPPDESVPALTRMLTSNSQAAMTAGCRTLGEIDAFESRHALGAFMENAPRGTQPWFACTIARARLGDADAQKSTRFITTYLGGADLIAAADVLMKIDETLAVTRLLQVTRQETGILRLEAADRLVSAQPEAAAGVVERALRSQDPVERAAALVIYRRLKLPATPEIRAGLVDPEPLVRLRTAEVVLAAEARRRG